MKCNKEQFKIFAFLSCQLEFTCINKSSGHHENPYTAISHLGWINEENNKEGKSTRTEMYRWIMDGGVAYVRDDYGNVSNLIIAAPPFWNKVCENQARRYKVWQSFKVEGMPLMLNSKFNPKPLYDYYGNQS